MLGKRSLELMTLRLPSQGQGLGLTLSGAPSGLGRRGTARGEAGGMTRFAPAEKAPAGEGPGGGRGGRRGQGWRGVAWAGAHQGLAVTAGNRAQGVALVEVVHEAHAAAQHRAGAQEVGDHLLPADAAIPVGGGGAPQVGPSPGSPTTGLTHPTGETPYQAKHSHPTPDFGLLAQERER